MKNKILTLVALVAAAGLIMAFGCGGKAFMGPGEEGYTGESVPIQLTTTLTGHQVDTSANKNISTPTGILGGGIEEETGQEKATMTCWFDLKEFSPGVYKTVPGGLVDIVDLTDIGTSAADCATAGKPAGACLAWKNIYDDVVNFPEKVYGYIEGKAPLIPGIDSEQVPLIAKCKPHFEIADVNADEAFIKQLITITNGNPWVENSAYWDHMNEDSINSGVYIEDLSYVGGGLSFAADPRSEDTIDAWNSQMPVSAVHWIDVTSAPAGQSIIEFTHADVSPVQLFGASSGGSTRQVGNIEKAWTFVTNRTLDDMGVDIIAPLATIASLSDATNNPISGGSIGDYSSVNLTYYGPGAVSQINSDNLKLSLVSPLAGQLQPMTAVDFDSDPATVGSIYLAANDAVDYALQDFDLMIKGQMATVGGLATLQEEGIHHVITMKCASQDKFNVEASVFDATRYCWYDSNKVSFTNDPIPATLSTADALAAGMLSFYQDANDYTNNALRFTAGNAAAPQIYALTKMDIARESMLDIATMGVYVKGISGFSNAQENITLGTRDAVYFVVREQAEGGKFMAFGWEKYIPQLVHTSTVTVSGDLDSNGGPYSVKVDGVERGPVAFDTDHATTWLAVSNAIKTDPGVLQAEVTGVYEITVKSVSKSVALDIDVLPTLGPLIFTQATVSGPGPGAPRLDCVDFAYDSSAALNKFTSGARVSCDTSTDLYFQWVSDAQNNTNYVIYDPTGQGGMGLFQSIEDAGEVYDVDYVQDINNPIGKPLIPSGFTTPPEMSIIVIKTVDLGEAFDLDQILMSNFYVTDQMKSPMGVGGPKNQ